MVLNNTVKSLSFHLAHTSTRIQQLQTRNNNSFQNATNLGTFKPNRSLSTTVRDSLGQNDRVDFFKGTIQPGVDTTGVFRLAATGKGVKIQFYQPMDNGGFKPYSSPKIVKPGASKVEKNSSVKNPSDSPALFYFKLTPIQGETTYKLELNYL